MSDTEATKDVSTDPGRAVPLDPEKEPQASTSKGEKSKFDWAEEAEKEKTERSNTSSNSTEISGIEDMDTSGTKESKSEDYTSQRYQDICEKLQEKLWEEFCDSGAPSPAKFNFNLTLYGGDEARTLSKAYNIYDQIKYFDNSLNNEEGQKLLKDDESIQEATEYIHQHGSHMSMTDHKWVAMSEISKRRALPILFLNKIAKRRKEKNLFLQAAQNAHAKKLNYIPNSGLAQVPPKVRKDLYQEHHILLKKLGLWKETDSKFPNTQQRSDYAAMARRGNSANRDESLTLFLFSGWETKADLPESTFATLKSNIINSNTMYALSDNFDIKNVSVGRIWWKPNHGIISCENEQTHYWLKEKMLDMNYTGGIQCRAWSPTERESSNIHFQVPKELSLQKFDILKVLLKFNPFLQDEEIELITTRPAKYGNTEVFLKAKTSIDVKLRCNTIRMPWGTCNILKGRPLANTSEDTPMEIAAVTPEEPSKTAEMAEATPSAPQSVKEVETPAASPSKTLTSVLQNQQKELDLVFKSPEKPTQHVSLRDRLQARCAPTISTNASGSEKTIPDKRTGSPSAAILAKIEQYRQSTKK
jgi:hypothetical protein